VEEEEVLRMREADAHLERGPEDVRFGNDSVPMVCIGDKKTWMTISRS
jgi:hypothetical protein